MTFPRQFSHFSFQTKVLIPVLTLLIALPAITVYLVNQHVQKMTLIEAQNRLATAEAVLLNSLEIHSRSQQIQFKNAVNEPRFKAVSQLDEETMRSYLRDLFKEFEPDVLTLIYTPIDGSAPSLVRRNTSINLDVFARSVAPSIDTSLGGELVADYYSIDGNLFNVVSVPAYLNNSGYPVGSLTIGAELGQQPISELKSLTRTELIFVSENANIGSSLTGALQKEAFRQISENPSDTSGQVKPALLAQEHFHLLENVLPSNVQGSPEIRYALLASYEQELYALAETRNILLFISLGGISVSVLIIWILIRRITSPLRSLRDGAEAVGRGDFSQRVECSSNDECGALARTFNDMTGNLQTSRRELENTVSELRETQEQLIQREERLRESEEGLRLIIEGARDHAIFTLNDNGQPLRWNNAANRILGYSSEEAKGLAYTSLFDQEDIGSNTPASLLATARLHGQATFEGWRIRKDGSRFWADVTLSRLPKVNGSDTGGFVEIARDITARKDAEVAMRQARDAAESSDRAKSEFLANMSHEFRTPMNGIIGMAGLLSSLDLSEEENEYVETIRYSADSLLTIIDDILDIAKIEAGQLEVSVGPINLVETVEEALQMFAPECEKKALELHLIVEPNVPGIVDTDANRLRQVIVNLVGNAIKFTKLGGITVRLSAPDNSQRLRIDIQDTGIGIEEDKLAKLFEPFFQVESSASRQYGGTGLGLTISRNIVQLLGGDISATSEFGKGSCFSFEIAAPAEPSSQIFSPLGNHSILLLSDNPLAQHALSTQLGHWGLRADAISSTPEIIRRALLQQSHQLVVVDDSAARVDTIRAIVKCREEIEDSFPTILRVLPLGHNDEGGTENFASVRKPLRPTALHRQIKKLLNPLPQSTELPESPKQIILEPNQVLEPRIEDPSPDFSTKNATSTRLAPPATSLAKPATAAKNATSEFAQQYPLRILVVEDNPINTKVLTKMLSKLGYHPDTAENGQEGWKAAEAVQYDLVLMDLQMPIMDGKESAKHILESDRIEHPIYISAFTANARQEDREDCKAVGMHDFVAKPARIEEVKDVLQRAHSWMEKQNTDA